MELTPLTDGAFRLDGGAMFGVVPKTLWKSHVDVDAENRVLLSMRPLLVRTGNRRVLIDAGIGDKMPARIRQMFCVDQTVALEASLAAAGLTAEDIDVVIATHLHLDHAGGFTQIVDGVVRPRFPRARYVIRRGEWDAAMAPNERTRGSYIRADFVPLAEAGLVDFIDDDVEILPGIRLCRTGGHTEHHQIVRFDSGGRTALYLADLVPTAAHVPAPWIMGYDLFPLQTLAAKQHWLGLAAEEEYVIFFEHDPAIAAGTIRVTDGVRRVEPHEAPA